MLLVLGPMLGSHLVDHVLHLILTEGEAGRDTLCERLPIVGVRAGCADTESRGAN